MEYFLGRGLGEYGDGLFPVMDIFYILSIVCKIFFLRNTCVHPGREEVFFVYDGISVLIDEVFIAIGFENWDLFL